MGSELIEAKNRVTELETAQAEDRAALSRANVAITRTCTAYKTLLASELMA